MSFYGFYKAPTQAELKAKAARAVKKGYNPVIIDGRVIATSWWGKAWCDNIDLYADNYNRLDRGKKYVRSNAVVDLTLGHGVVEAKVVGSRAKPYEVKVVIDPIDDANYKEIMKVCEGKLSSLTDLESGKFPKEYKELFTAKGKGLFPKLSEIRFICSCPDYSHMCKHIAAVLYAIGRRLDDNPLLFLELRGIDVKEFTDSIIKKEAERIWASVDSKIDEERLIKDEEAVRLFGFELPLKYDDKL